MKTTIYFYSCIFMIILLVSSCGKDEIKTGKLIFTAVKTMPAKKSIQNINETTTNNFKDGTITMHTINLKLTVTEIWVSQGEVTEGSPNNLIWHLIGQNNDLKYFDEYAFTVDALPAGVYKSIKMVFKNIWYRVAVLQSDTSEVMELRENMGTSDCSYEGTIPASFFSTGGNYKINENGKFYLTSSGEKVGGFEIQENKIAKVYWKLGGTSNIPITACTFDWVDVNNNGVWDCGTDRTDNFNCPPGVDVMWGFIVKYEDIPKQ
ncbi:MAG: hypothetical protein Q7J34_11545 [Bacteroidales bacterium]|nr:hypothetical protein [Bacteroidales bacterium]